MDNSQKIKIVLISIIFGALVIYMMFSSLKETTVYYHTVSEVLNKQIHGNPDGIRVSGVVKEGSIKKVNDSNLYLFSILDNSTKKELKVKYKGIVPDNFKDNAPVVVEGKMDYDKNIFFANTILLKCPSKYEKKVEKKGE